MILTCVFLSSFTTRAGSQQQHVSISVALYCPDMLTSMRKEKTSIVLVLCVVGLVVSTKHTRAKAGKRGRGAKYLEGPDWLRSPEILVKQLVMGATVKRVGGP